jgi:hypothetical protein
VAGRKAVGLGALSGARGAEQHYVQWERVSQETKDSRWQLRCKGGAWSEYEQKSAFSVGV